MSDASAIFAGSSRYANDFQQIIDRSLAIASLPLSQLNNQKNALTAQSTALADLQTKFTAIGGALGGISDALTHAVSIELSDEAVARATAGSNPLAGTYNLEVISLGSFTSTLSAAGLPTVANPLTESISAATSFTLTVDGTDHTVTPASGSLWDLAKAINSAGVGVRATIVNIGSNASPDYRLSVQSTKLAATTIQLSDGASSLLDTLSTGSAAQYKVNGQPAAPISSDSRTVTLSPGLTVDLLAVGTTEITVAPSADKIRETLSSLVEAFNAAVDEVDKHRGSGKGALAGQSLLYTLAQSLRSLGNYSAGAESLNSLGISFDKTGKLTFDDTTFTALAETDFDGLLSLLGDTTTGGFLKAANDSLEWVNNTTDGFLQLAVNSNRDDLKKQDTRINDAQDRIDLLRQTLSAKMAAADALIASLEQNVVFLNGLFDALRPRSN